MPSAKPPLRLFYHGSDPLDQAPADLLVLPETQRPDRRRQAPIIIPPPPFSSSTTTQIPPTPQLISASKSPSSSGTCRAFRIRNLHGAAAQGSQLHADGLRQNAPHDSQAAFLRGHTSRGRNAPEIAHESRPSAARKPRWVARSITARTASRAGPGCCSRNRRLPS